MRVELSQLVSDLPAFSDNIKRCLELMNDPDSSLMAVASVIEKDLQLSSRILRIANSAFYGFPQKVSTVPHAVVILGLSLLKAIIISSSIFEKVPVFAKELNRHGVSCAFIAREMAARENRQFKFSIYEAATAGLMHDIGKSIIAIQMPEEFKKIQRLVNEADSWCEAEAEVLGFTHTDLNEVACEKWCLPEVLREALVFHHEVEKARKYGDLVHIIARADMLDRNGNAKGHSA